MFHYSPLRCQVDHTMHIMLNIKHIQVELTLGYCCHWMICQTHQGVIGSYHTLY